MVNNLNLAYKIRYYRSALTILIAVAATGLNGSCALVPSASFSYMPVKIVKTEVKSEQFSQTHSGDNPAPSKLTLPGEQMEIFQYMLDLINSDRKYAGLAPVTLGDNTAAQAHARDMLNNYYISHWGTDGLKPYMRYTQAGGLNYEQENDAYRGWHDPDDNPAIYAGMDVKRTLYELEYAMMNYDGPSEGHRKNILNQLHKKVNLGIAYDSKRLALVQQFEGDYIEYALPPALNGNIFTVSGRLLEGRITSIQICFDELPKPLTPYELASRMNGSYSLGDQVGYIIPPLPQNRYYTLMPPNSVVADQWRLSSSGQFIIKADIGKILSRGKGVYTIVLIVDIKDEPRGLTNYSIFVG
jgi:uncharacterized protein YkwD